VIVFSLPHRLPADTQLYGESFQMLSQTAGTIGQPADLGYSEPKHYKVPGPADATVVTGLLTLTPPGQPTQALAFTSCRRFNGRFYLRPGAIDVAVDTEGLELGPGETWALEEVAFAEGPPRAELLAGLAKRINENHPPLRFKQPPTGWCSWYCFGPKVTDKDVLDNLAVIAKGVPQLKYVQIDDGYQPAMGDWLETGKAFGGNVKGVLEAIRKRGFEPAIWVAPFIADKGKWPNAHDVMYWDQWPVAQPALAFGANAFSQKEWLAIWERLDHAPASEEVIRNLPVRHPLIWINK